LILKAIDLVLTTNKKIVCPVLSAAIAQPNSVFIEQQRHEDCCEFLSFAEFNAWVSGVSEHLSSELPIHERADNVPVVILVEKNWQSIVALFALMRAGYIAVPVAVGTPPQRLAQLKAEFSIQHVYSPHTLLRCAKQRVLSTCGASCDVDNTRPCLGIFTSGSSGSPKLVIHNYASLLSNARGANLLIPLEVGDRCLLSLSVYHIGGLAQIVRALVSKTRLVIAGVVENPSVLHDFAITHTSMVSTQLQRLLANKVELPNLKAVLIGGGPCAKQLITEGLGLGYPLWLTYGMSESASQLITESPQGLQSIINGSELAVTDDGELLVRGRNLFMGYWQSPGIVVSGRDSDGWFHTRDLVSVDQQKYQIVGRVDNQFISGGKNIQPEEIERQLTMIEAVLDAIVVPVEHAEFGLTSFAFLRWGTPHYMDDTTVAQLVGTLKKRLPSYLVPRHYALLPLAAGSGAIKYRRVVLQQKAAELMKHREHCKK